MSHLNCCLKFGVHFSKDITFPVGKDTRTMKGEAYLKHWVLPNMYFHITTAYLILRHNGVMLGKRDYLVGAANT